MLPSESIVPVFWRVWLAPRLTFDQLRSRGVTWWDWIVAAAIGAVIFLLSWGWSRFLGVDDLIGNYLFGDQTDEPLSFYVVIPFFIIIPFVIALFFIWPSVPIAARLGRSVGDDSVKNNASILMLMWFIGSNSLFFIDLLFDPLVLIIIAMRPPFHAGLLKWAETVFLFFIFIGLGILLTKIAFSRISTLRAMALVATTSALQLIGLLLVTISAGFAAFWLGWNPFEATS